MDNLDIKEFANELINMVNLGDEINVCPDDWDSEETDLDDENECECEDCSCERNDEDFCDGYETSFADLTQEEFDKMYENISAGEDGSLKFPVRLTCSEDDKDPIDLELDIDTLNMIFEISRKKNCSVDDAISSLIKEALDHLQSELDDKDES